VIVRNTRIRGNVEGSIIAIDMSIHAHRKPRSRVAESAPA
jgi:hypothetical protein